MVLQLIATILNRLAKLYEERSDYEQAEKQYQRAVRFLDKVRTSVARERLRVQVLGNLAGLYRILGHYDKSEALLHEVLALARTLFGPTDLQLAALLTNLAVLHKYQGRF